MTSFFPNHLTCGDFNIHGLRDGFFHLDGGAMFGVVPKTLWDKVAPADEFNRIRLGLNSILITTGDKRILVDTGMGTLMPDRFYDYYSVENKPGLVEALHGLDVRETDIDFVINTHLHFDHCGGNTRADENGNPEPTYPRARYVVQQGEWEHALDPTPRDRASYLRQFFLPLERSGQLQLVNGNVELLPGLEVVPTPGHTRHHQCVKIQSRDEVVFFLGDMIPTSAHVGLPYIMSYDLYPVETLKTKEEFLKASLKDRWIVAFNHDPDFYFAHIRYHEDKDKYSAEACTMTG